MRGFLNFFCKKKAYLLNILFNPLEDGYFCSTTLLHYFPFQRLKKKTLKKPFQLFPNNEIIVCSSYTTSSCPQFQAPKYQPTIPLTFFLVVLLIQSKIDKQQFKI